MRCRQILWLLLSILLVGALRAQPGGGSGTGPKEKSLKSQRKIRQELRTEAKEKRRKERAERKAIKQYHKRLQTSKVRKRMKSSRKTAIRNNEHRREFFLKRWFKKKKRV